MDTLRETATRLRVSTRTVQRWIDAGALPAFRVGRVIRIEETALEGFIMRASQPEAPPCPTAAKTPRIGQRDKTVILAPITTSR